MRISDWSSDVCSSDLLAVALPQQFDAVRATCGVAVADAERLPGDMRHRADMGTFGVTFFGRQQAHRLRHRHRRGERRHSPHVHFRYDDIAQRMAFQRHDANLFQGRNRSEEHTSELQSLMRISYAVFCLKKKKPPYK